MNSCLHISTLSALLFLLFMTSSPFTYANQNEEGKDENSRFGERVQDLVPEKYRSHPEYGKVKLKRSRESFELIHKRSANTRTFLNPDGTYSKQKTGGRFHYKDKKGRWRSIQRQMKKLKSSVYGINRTGLPIKIDAQSGKTQMNLTKSGQMSFGQKSTLKIENTDGQVYDQTTFDLEDRDHHLDSRNRLIMENVAPGIDRMQTVRYYKVATDYVIKRRPDISIDDGQAVFTDYYQLEEGWSVEKGKGEKTDEGTWQGELVILNKNGEEIGKFRKPLVYEKADSKSKQNENAATENRTPYLDSSQTKNQEDLTIEASYRIHKTNGQLAIAVVVPLKWLMDKGREFPVIVDPTASNTYSSGKINSCHYNAFGSPLYNTASMSINVPNNVQVTSTDVQARLRAYNGAWLTDGFVRFVGNNSSSPTPPSFWHYTANYSGSYTFSFSNLNIADGTYASGSVPLELDVTRDWGTQYAYSCTECGENCSECGCDHWTWACWACLDPDYCCWSTTCYNNYDCGDHHVYIYNNTWKATVTYCPVVVASVDQGSSGTICSGETQNLSVSASGGTGFSYQWFRNGVAISGATSSSITVSQAGNYSVEVTNNCGHTASSNTYTLNVDQTPSANAGGDISRCDPGSISMNGASAGGTYNSIDWSGAGSLGSFSGSGTDPSTYTFTPSQPSGSFTATLTVYGSGACNGTNATDTRQISWDASPTANAGSDINACSNNSIPMAGSSATNYDNFYWSGGNGLGTWNPGQNPDDWSFTPYDTSGTFTATLVVQGNGECSNVTETDSRQIQLDEAPEVEASADIQQCSNNNVAMINATADNYSSFSWSGGSSLGSWNSGTNPDGWSFVPNANTTNGSFTATLTVDGAGACSSTTVTDARQVNLDPAPVAIAGADLNKCSNNTSITMSGASASNASNINWSGGSSFGNWKSGTNADDWRFTPNDTSGTFTATLTVQGSGECSNVTVTDTRQIKLDKAPEVGAGSDIQHCSNNNADMVNASASDYSSFTWSDNNTLGSWDSSGASAPNDVTFVPNSKSTSGSFTATLRVTGKGACSSTTVTDSRKVNLDPAPVAMAGTDLSKCSNNSNIAMAGASASGYTTINWTGGNGLGNWNPGTNADDWSFSPYDTSGTFTATLIVQGGGECDHLADTARRQITLDKAPEVQAGGDIQECNNNNNIAMSGASSANADTLYWSGGSALGSWNSGANADDWDFSPNSPTTSGTFTATLMVVGSGACSSDTVSDARQIELDPAPVATVGADLDACSNNSVQMVNSSVENEIDYQWSGGNSLGTWNSGTDADDWEFVPNADTTSGSFTATLTVDGSGYCNGIQAQSSRQVTLYKAPVADAGNDTSTCGSDTIPLNDAEAFGQVSSISWSKSSGTGSGSFNGSGTDPSTYEFDPSTNTGQITAKLTVSYSCSCSDPCDGASDTDSVDISWGNNLPTATAGNAVNGCSKGVIQMNGASAGGAYSKVWWEGGNTYGTWDTGANADGWAFSPTTASGSFTASLIVKGDPNCSSINDTATRTVSWDEAPSGSAGSDLKRCTGTSPISMVGASATAGGSVDSVAWQVTNVDSGGGSFPTGASIDPTDYDFNPTTSNGAVEARLTIFGDQGCEGVTFTDTRTIEWEAPPKATAGGALNGCSNSLIYMDGASASGAYNKAWWEGGNVYGTWDTGAHADDWAFLPDKTTTSGSFTATLIVQDDPNCPTENDTATRTISWDAAPSGTAGSDLQSCRGASSIPMDGASASGAIDSLRWQVTSVDSGAGGFTTGPSTDPSTYDFNPTTSKGQVEATLEVFGDQGCADVIFTDSRTIQWDVPPEAHAGGSISGCSNSLIAMDGASAGGAYSQINWEGGNSLGTWISGTNADDWSFFPATSSGSFTAELIVKNNKSSCPNDTSMRTVSWNEDPSVNAGNDRQSCTGTSSIPMDGASVTGAIDSVAWDVTNVTNGSGSFSTGTSTDPTTYNFNPSSASGEVEATLTAFGGQGCKGVTAIDTRTIEWATTLNANAGNKISACGKPAIDLTGATASGTVAAVQWQIQSGTGNGQFSCSVNCLDPANWQFNPNTSTGDIQAQLIVDGPICTPDTSIRRIVWNAEPSANAGNAITLCTGTSPIQMSGASAGGSVDSVYWSGGNGTWSGAGNDPSTYTFTPNDSSGSFNAELTVIGSGACSADTAKDKRAVSWEKRPIANAGGDIDQCFDSVITMKGASVVGNIDSFKWSGGSGTWTQSQNDPAQATYSPTSNAGSFTATLTAYGSGNCQDTADQRQVTWSDKPVATAGDTIEVCYNGGAITLTGSQAGGTYDSVAWTGGGGLGSFQGSGTDPSTYEFLPITSSGSISAQLQVFGANVCSASMATDTRMVIWHNFPSISSVFTSDVTDCNDDNGIISIFAQGNGPFEYSIDGGNTFYQTQEFDTLSAGTYNIVVRDANGCSVTYSNNPVTLQAPPSFNVENVSVTDAKCSGLQSGQIVIDSVSGGFAPYDYSITNGASYQSSDSLFDAYAGTYYIKVRDRFGCIATYANNPVTVNGPSAPLQIDSIDVVNIGTSCGADSSGKITVHASGGTTPLEYNINGGAFSSDSTFDMLQAGEYELMVRDANNCPAVASAVVNAPWTAEAGVDKAICSSSDSVTLQGQVAGVIPENCEGYTTRCTGSGCGVPDYSGCPANYSNTSGEWITNVSFSNINHSSGSGGYQDFSATGADTATVSRGNTVTITVDIEQASGNNNTEYVTAFIDWNRSNLFFDAGEVHQIGSTNNNPGTVSGNITVPSGADLGHTKMRVVVNRGSYQTSRCFCCETYGETEAYALELIDGGLGPCSPSFNWTPTTGLSNDTVAQPLATPNTTTTYTLEVDMGNGCVQTDNVTVRASDISNANVSMTSKDLSCNGQNNGSLELTPTNGLDPYLLYGPDKVHSVAGKHRKIAITNPDTVQINDFQVHVSLPHTPSMRADFGDVRFYDAFGNKLNFWLADYTLSDSADFWVKVPYIPPSGTQIYAVYGNNNLTTTSDGEATFAFFDDFSSIDTSKWEKGTIHNTQGDEFTISIDGNLEGGNNNRYYETKRTFSDSLILESKVHVSSYPTNGFMTAGFFETNSNAIGIRDLSGSSSKFSDGAFSSFGSLGSQGKWVRNKVVAAGSSSSVERSVNGGNSVNASITNSGLNNEHIRLGALYDLADNNENYQAQWEWITVRKYKAKAPTVSVGPEQNPNSKIDSLSPGAYQVGVVDMAGCTVTKEDTIEEPAPLTIDSLEVDSAACGQNNGAITVVTSGGTSPYQYNIIGDTSTQTSNVLQNLSVGQHTIKVADDNSCNTSGTATVGLDLTQTGVFTWKGDAQGNTWHNPVNWGCDAIPDSSQHVVIPASPTQQPVIYPSGTNNSDGDGECKTIELQPGSELTIKSGAKLFVNP